MPLSKFQGKHCKKGIFIVGNGPTVLNQDLSVLKNRLTIAVNVNPFSFDPNYLVFMDPVAKIVDRIKDCKSVKITRKVDWKSKVTPPEETIVVNADTSSMSTATGTWKGKLFMGNSSLVAGMHLAWIMGCDPVVIVGAPLCIVDGRKRFYENPIDLAYERSRWDRERLVKYNGHMTTRYYITQMRFIIGIARLMAKSGVRVYNATEGGILSAIPCIRLGNAVEVTNPKTPSGSLPKFKVEAMKKIKRVPTRFHSIPLSVMKPVQKNLPIRHPNPKPKKYLKLDLPALDTKDIAMATIVNDAFMPGFVGFAKSLKKYNPWITTPLHIMHSKSMCTLSDRNKSIIRELYPQAVMHAVDERKYSGINFNRSHSHRFNISYLTLESFSMEGFKKVLFLDVDMLFLGDISYLLNKNVEMGVTPDTNRYSTNEVIKNAGDHHTRFNGGLLSIGEPYLNAETFKRLVDVSRPGHSMAEQQSMNIFFARQPLFYFDSTYNALKRGFQDKKNSEFLKQVKILHFIGRKPWVPLNEWRANEPRMRMRESGYDHIDQLWKKHHDE